LLFLLLWLVKLHAPSWTRPTSLFSVYSISACNRYCISASAGQNQLGSKGSLFSCCSYAVLCHCSPQRLNLTVLLYGRHGPGSWPRAAKAIMFFPRGFCFPYSTPTVRLTTPPMATCTC